MAFDLATNLTPILNGVIAILPLFLDLVIAMVPIVITLAVIRQSVYILDARRTVSRVLTRVLRQDSRHDQVLICQCTA
jgi:hypothetical protein